MNSPSANSDPPLPQEVLDWAEFLYEEYTRYKHKQFSSTLKSKTIDPNKRGKND